MRTPSHDCEACPYGLGIYSGGFLLSTLCRGINDQDLALLQSGVFASGAKIHSKIFNPDLGQCVDSELQPFLMRLIPDLHNGLYCMDFLDTFYLQEDWSRRVLMEANSTMRMGAYVFDAKWRVLVDSCPKPSCLYKIKLYEITDYQCTQ